MEEAVNWVEEEKYHALELEHERSLFCAYEHGSGDKRWPVVCGKDQRYATRKQCDNCKEERAARNERKRERGRDIDEGNEVS
jgi:hypothetical protein